jgi:hypothetical protein
VPGRENGLIFGTTVKEAKAHIKENILNMSIPSCPEWKGFYFLNKIFFCDNLKNSSQEEGKV